MACKPSCPSIESRAEEEGGEHPERSPPVATKPTETMGYASRSDATGPAVKTSKPSPLASWRIAPLVAFGLGLENSGRRASTTTDITPIARV